MVTKLYSITETAQQLGLGRVRVWQLINRSKLPAQRIGNQWAISHQAIAAFKRRDRRRGVRWQRRQRA